MRWMDSRATARHIGLLILMALCVSPTLAQDSQPTSAQSQFSVIPITPPPSEPPPAPATGTYYLRVTGDNVNLRTRADLNSLPVAKLSRDAVLLASGGESGWHKVAPPNGVFVVVARQYVRRESPTRGVVETSSGALRVRAASLIMPVDPNKCDVVSRLQPGTPVEIVGEQGEWLRIVPPADVFYYVSTGFVEQISSDTANTLSAGATPLAPSEIVAEQGTPVTDAGAATSLPKPTAVAETPKNEEPAATPSVAATPTTAPAVALNEGESPKTTTGAAPASAPTKPATTTPRNPANEQSAKDEEPVPQPTRMGFDAQGVLRPTFALPAGPNGLRYKLQDPYTKKVRAYVEIPYDLSIDLKKALGAYVGIQGQAFNEPTTGVQVYKATAVTILE